MNVFKQLSEITRDPDRGMLFGVCAGIADYYRWRVRTVRFAAVVLAFLLTWPVVLAYIIAIFVFPTVDERAEQGVIPPSERRQQTDARRTPVQYHGALRDRYARIETRMQRVEAYLHGNEYQLRTAFRDLES